MIQMLVIFMIIGFGISIIPFYMYARHLYHESFLKHFFLANVLCTGFTSFLTAIIGFGSYQFIFFIFGVIFFISGGFYKGYKDKGERWKIIALMCIFISSAGIFFGMLIYWVFFARGNFPSITQVPLTQFYEASLFLALIAAINAIPIFDLYKNAHARRLQLFMLTVICFGILLLIFIGATIPTAQVAGGGNIFSTAIFAVMADPIVSTTLVLMIFGGILKSLDNWQADIIGDIMIFFLPLMIWSMAMIGMYPNSDDTNFQTIMTLFGEKASCTVNDTEVTGMQCHLLSTFTYVFIMGCIYMIETGMILLFTGLTRSKIKLF